jgi:peptidyl-tRNA hydrolase, PTH2 family
MWKQVIVVRKDLKLSPGKLAAQVAHASVEAYRKSGSREKDAWEGDGSKKVVLKAENEAELFSLQEAARRAKLPGAIIRDAGRTEVEPGTVTALGIGPGTEEEIDRITGHLKML